MAYGVVLALHLLVCLSLVGIILVQSGKGGGLAGGAFGAQAQATFGGRGANDFITRATIGLGIAFFVTSLSLALMTSHGGVTQSKSLIQEEARKAQSQQAAPQAGRPGAAAPGAPATGAPSAPAPAPAGGGK